MSSQQPTVNLSRESKREIVDALRDIRKAIIADERKTQSFTENIADSLTSGSSFVRSIREAVKVETTKSSEKIKRALDPLEIMKRMSGGSKLATTLLGKATGRSNDDIRKSIGLRQNEPDVVPEPPRQELTPTTSQVMSGEAIPLLEQIARSISLISLRVTDIADKMKATKKVQLDANGRLRDKVTGQFMSAQTAKEVTKQQELLKEIRDSLMGIRKDDEIRYDKTRDEERAKNAMHGLKPTVQVSSTGQQITKPTKEAGLFDGILGSFTKFGVLLGEFALSLSAILHPMETFKTGLQFLSKGAEAVKDTFSFFSKGEKVADALSTAGKVGEVAVKGEGLASKAISAGARIGQKLFPKKDSAAKLAAEEADGAAKALTKGTEHVAEAGAKAVAEVPKSAPAKKTITKVGKDKLQKIMAARLPKAFGGAQVGKIIPGVGAALGLGFAISRLVKGDIVGAALEAASGFGGAVTAIPAIVGQLVRDVYQEAYGMFPEADPLAGDRLPELADTVKTTAADWLKGKDSKSQEAPKGPDSLSTPGTQLAKVIPEMGENMTGNKLAQSTQMKQELSSSSGQVQSAPSAVTVQNVTNNKSNAVFTPGLPSSRSQDSSYLRALDHNTPGIGG